MSERTYTGGGVKEKKPLLFGPLAGFVQCFKLCKLFGPQLNAIMHGLDVGQIGRLHWHAIGFLNLCVRLKDSGQADVSRFKRCMYCESEGELRIKKPWADWYAQLPEV